jgi:hypothetical protein
LVAGAMLATTATMAVMLLLNSVAYEGALWRAGESEVARGIPPMSIDAGLDWLGLHATGDIAQVDAPNPVDRARDTKFWPSYRQCVVVTNSPVKWSGVTLAEKRDKAYRMFLFKGAWRPLYIYRSTDRNCAG